MELLWAVKRLVGKPIVRSNFGERVAAGCGLLLMAVGFWALWTEAYAPAERHVREPWLMYALAYLFTASIILSVAHKMLIISGTFVSPLGLASTVAMVVVLLGHPVIMALAGQTFRSSPSSLYDPSGWVGAGGLIIGGVGVDIFMWMYELMRQHEDAPQYRE